MNLQSILNIPTWGLRKHRTIKYSDILNFGWTVCGYANVQTYIHQLPFLSQIAVQPPTKDNEGEAEGGRRIPVNPVKSAESSAIFPANPISNSGSNRSVTEELQEILSRSSPFPFFPTPWISWKGANVKLLKVHATPASTYGDGIKSAQCGETFCS